MPPDDSRKSGPLTPRRSYLTPRADQVRPASRDAAAGMVRGQIEAIYQGTSRTSASPSSHQQEAPNPYERTHQAGRTALQMDQWKQYHSAWQDYYRQYYERYYLGEVYRMRQTFDTQRAKHTDPVTSDDKPASDEVIFSLKRSLLGKVGDSAIKVRKSRHFVPIMAASLTMIVFLFLQYNRILFANVEAYVSPGNIDPANIIVDPSLNVPIGSDPKLIIPKINVDVPVVYDTKPDKTSQLKAMENGVAWFGIPGANSHPGQIGNTVISGHSSNDLFDQGDYKFIFARLEQLDINDTFYLNYEGTRYAYSITKKEVVQPTDVQKLIYPTDKPVVTLITCVPLGTARSRLLVTAEQISPSPAQAKAAPSAPDTGEVSADLPGNSPTFLSRIFQR